MYVCMLRGCVVSPATYESTTVRSVAVTPNPWSIDKTRSFAMVVADGGGSITADKEVKRERMLTVGVKVEG